MSAPLSSTFLSFPCKIAEIRLDRALACGQNFRWKQTTQGEWTGVIGNAVWRLKQSETEIFYQTFRNVHSTLPMIHPMHKFSSEDSLESCCKCVSNGKKSEDIMCNCQKTDLNILRDYLQLNVSLENMYELWSESDENFRNVARTFTGIRMLRQDPIECLFSFICSSNNNISRITSMVEKLASNYGEKIMELDGQEYFSFPQVSSLAKDGVEERLRTLGFGYRAKYIQRSAEYIIGQGGEKWLYDLREMDYPDAKASLLKLCGVGAKVADCVLLMCLDKPGAIPVDTHVWQIAARDYMPKLKQAKSLTDTLYNEIGDHFRSLWGPYAGWAHSVLFTADLRQFQEPGSKKPMVPSPGKRRQTMKMDKQPVKRSHYEETDEKPVTKISKKGKKKSNA
ncbi:N-glycosylase/DNA lyase-like [Mya arenaria]|uniref:N-glycosylase/DNA lyase-like n=1 Tax=Mya arenaria TaxID=6604 RepID=UPI0022DF5776|nr:N-glycosylase/DNA lyase-like [Mya arenaria]